MKTSLIFLSLLFSVGALFAQTRNPARDINRANVWHFGHASVSGAKDAPSLHFDNVSPYVLNIGNPSATLTASSLCDLSGNLQMYSGYFSLYNQTHFFMANAGFVGDSGWIGISQANLAVPKPNNPDIVYYFSASVTLKYSVVDISLNNGIGAVIERNVELHPYPVEAKLAAVHHCNGTDVWVVGHIWQTNQFYAYLITENGIDTTPVITAIGPVSNTPGYWQAGTIKFSPNGGKVAITFGGPTIPPFLFDFNNSTGIISNPVALQKEFDGSESGLSFSLNNNILYVSTHNNLILQYSLNAGDSNDIANSRKVIFDAAAHNTVRSFGRMQIGRDGKIYIIQQGAPGNDYLAIIHNPNELDTLCNFELQGLYLNGARGAGGFNTIESYFYSGTTAYPCYGDTTSTNFVSSSDSKLNVRIFPNPFTDYALIEINDIVPKESSLSLRLFDVLGREYEPEITVKGANIHGTLLVFHRSQLTDGYYFLTIKTAYKMQTIKLSIF